MSHRHQFRCHGTWYFINIVDDERYDVDLDVFHAQLPVGPLDEDALLDLRDVYDTAALINDQHTCNVVVDRVTHLLRTVSLQSQLEDGQQSGLSAILESVLNDHTSNARARPFLKLTQSALPYFGSWLKDTQTRLAMLHSMYSDIEVSGTQQLEELFSRAARGECVFHDDCDESHVWGVPAVLTMDGNVGPGGQLLERHYTGFSSMFGGWDDPNIEDAEELSWPEAESVDDEGFCSD
ncbi:hypothetical protein LTR09_011426 [Extremus antarcticus]|uniref:Uncharacterized protein n=1 Tax=Extremus antarcticus TaxID=702011 RepID=A0AAJ0D6E6_9PEZI|nr:hypothetical protein LTR09_011426 [Extremus antarcticus]